MGNKVQLFVEANTQKAETDVLKFTKAVGMTEEEFKALQTSMASPEFDRFSTRLNRNAQAAEYFGGKTEALTREQNMLRREMERLIRRGSSDSEYFKMLETSYKKVGFELDQFQKSMASGECERFVAQLDKDARAAEYFGNKTDGLRKKQSMLRREMEKLIRQGSSETAYFKKLEESYKGVTREIDAATRKQSSFSSFMQKISGSSVAGLLPFVGVAGAVTGVVRELDRSTEAATKAESELAKYNVTYSEIGEQADSAVSTLADQFDMAESSVQGMLGSVGDLLSGFGATQDQSLELASSAGYLGGALSRMSPHLGTAAEATDDLAKAALGERDALKKWGVVITEAQVQSTLLEKGQNKLLGTELQLAKAAAVMEIAYSQSSNALRAAESGTVNAAIANQMWAEALKESRELTGQWINEFATPFKVHMSEILQSINENRKAYREFQDTLDSGESMDDLVSSGNEAAVTSIRGMINELARLSGIGSGMYPEADAENMLLLIKRVSEEFHVSKAQVIEIAQEMGYATDEARDMLSITLEEEEALKKHQREVEQMAEGYSAMATAYREGMQEAQQAMEKNREEMEKMNLSASEYKEEISQVYSRKLEDLGITDEIARLEVERSRVIEDQRESAEKSHILEKNFNDNILPSINAYYDEMVRKTREKLEMEEDEESLLESLIGSEKDRVAEIEEAKDALKDLTSLQEQAFVQGDSSMVELLGEVQEALEKIINSGNDAGNSGSSSAGSFWDMFENEFQIGARKEALAAGDVMSAVVVDPATMLMNIAMSLAESFTEASFMIGEAIRYSDWEGVGEDMAELFMDAFTDNMGPVGAFLDGLFGAVKDEDVRASELELKKVLRDLDETADKEKELQELRLENLEELVEKEKEAMDEMLDEIKNRYSTEFSILRDSFDRNLISADDYRTQSAELFADQQEEEAAAAAPYEKAVKEEEDEEKKIAKDEAFREKHLENLRNRVLADLIQQQVSAKKKLNNMSWAEKTFTRKDEKLKDKIDDLGAMISLVKRADSIDEINDITGRDYKPPKRVDEPATEIQMAAKGADFITNGPRLLLVGENAGGRERVSVTPLSSPNINGPSHIPAATAQVINVNLNGPVLGIDDLTRQIDEAKKRLVSRGIIAL